MNESLLVLLAALSSVSQPQTVLTPPIETRLPGAQPVDTRQAAPAQLRELSLSAAERLLKSTEGPVWRPYAIHAPACEVLAKKPTRAEKAACTELKKSCTQSEKWGRKYGVHPLCSSLYPHTTVLLTTAPKVR